MGKLDLICSMEHRICSYSDDDALGVFCKKVGFTFLPDRFGYLNQFTRWKMSEYKQRFPAGDASYSLIDIIDKRAQEVIDIARITGKKLYVLYSGGVDSTTVLLSLIKALGGDFGILRVVYTQSSVKEYPLLYEQLQKWGINLVYTDGCDLVQTWYNLSRSDYVVTGFPADQLFGSIVNQKYPDLFFSDWRKYIEEDNAIQQFEAAFTNYGLPIKTQGEFLWFMNFACKWEIVKMFFPCLSGMTNGLTLNFFDTYEFQNWTISNYDRLFAYPQSDPAHYKEAMKDYIYSILHDDDYRMTKGKIGSVGNAYRNGENIKATIEIPTVAIIADGKFIQQSYHKLCGREEAVAIRKAMLRRMVQPYRKKKYGSM